MLQSLYPCQIAAVDVREYEHRRIVFDIKCALVKKSTSVNFDILDGLRPHMQNEAILSAFAELCENCEYKNKAERMNEIIEKQEK